MRRSSLDSKTKETNRIALGFPLDCTTPSKG